MSTSSHSDLWGKAKPRTDEGPQYHPLALHCLDVAACADAILAREPEATRQRMAATLGLAWGEARAWLLIAVASHDLGKASPGFQAKWPNLLDQTGLSFRVLKYQHQSCLHQSNSFCAGFAREKLAK
ncbi:MAG: CRISPR-associated endonuclease Cas3'' [Rhodocyclaceae bacterium]|nr:CRISPR-associated endonuclease Cas3'' [Rhodocyclaceae bacterium]